MKLLVYKALSLITKTLNLGPRCFYQQAVVSHDNKSVDHDWGSWPKFIRRIRSVTNKNMINQVGDARYYDK